MDKFQYINNYIENVDKLANQKKEVENILEKFFKTDEGKDILLGIVIESEEIRKFIFEYIQHHVADLLTNDSNINDEENLPF